MSEVDDLLIISFTFICNFYSVCLNIRIMIDIICFNNYHQCIAYVCLEYIISLSLILNCVFTLHMFCVYSTLAKDVYLLREDDENDTATSYSMLLNRLC